MSPLAAITKLVQVGAKNTRELTTALQSIKMSSPIADVRVNRALCNALAGVNGGDDLKLTSAERDQLYEMIAETRGVGRPPSDGESATGHIHLRVTMERKNRYVRAAKHGGKSLSEWMTAVCDRASSE